VPTNPPALVVNHVSKIFGSGSAAITVLRDVSFVVPAGTSLSIVGPSGSGKTTLLGIAAGIDNPSAGQVNLLGRNLGSLGEEEKANLRALKIGFVFQSHQLLPSLTALENILVPGELAGRPAKQAGMAAKQAGMAAKQAGMAAKQAGMALNSIEDEALALLSRIGLEERGKHFPAQLSGGELQRISVARAFLNRPEILFVDEPTGNLDEENKDMIVSLIFALARERGATLILVTHDLDLAAMTDKILELRNGRIE